MAEKDEGLREGLWQILHNHKRYDEWSGVVLDIVSFATPIYDKEKQEAVKAERERIIRVIESKATFVVAEKDKILLKFLNQPNAVILSMQDLQALKGE